MQFDMIETVKSRKTADIAFLPYWMDGKKIKAAFPKNDFDEEFLSLIEKDFTAKVGETLFSYIPNGKEQRILLIGLGSFKECSAEDLRKSFAAAAQLCRKKKLESVNLFIPEELTLSLFPSILDGLSMANYSYDYFKRETLKEKPSNFLKKIHLIGASKQMKNLVEKNEHLMEGVNLTRDLVNGNADEVKASYLVSLSEELEKKYSAIKLKVLGKKELEKEKMGLMLAVNRGAAHDPALILLHYVGDPKSKDLTAIVGKGVTFDTGGLNLKPTGSMETMKCDMAGAAAVLGVIQACAALNLRKNVIGVIAAAENAIGAESYKPGDVYISHAGKSVEITNTDAEGRLVLADAFSYIQGKYELTEMIDFATLTGGVIIALGDEAAGLFSNDKKLTQEIEESAEVTGERVWELPLYPEYLDALKSPIADLKNARSGRKASAASGAMFLKQFVHKDLPWAHLDIAGTAYLSETSAYHPSYATGFGVKLMIEFLSR